MRCELRRMKEAGVKVQYCKLNPIAGAGLWWWWLLVGTVGAGRPKRQGQRWNEQSND